MKKTDVIVIGGGMSGLMAAAAAASRGKQVTLLTKGVGTIAIGGGTVDVLGCQEDGMPLGSPAEGLTGLDDSHPYARIGQERLQTALRFFLEICAQEEYSYLGSLDGQQWLPTVAGTLKPSCLVPLSMNTEGLAGAKRVAVAGFKGLKDYYPEIIVEGLRKNPGFENTVFETIMLDAGFHNGRDIGALDIARWLDDTKNRLTCAQQLKNKLAPGTIVLLPPVLGTLPDYRCYEEMEETVGCRLIETVGLPPAVTGLRLRKMLVNYLKKQKVSIIEQANVVGAVLAGECCQAIITRNADRERQYTAASVIVATGGFFGGGLTAQPGRAWEPIFNLPVAVPEVQEDWGNEKLFSGAAQPFAKFGIAVDAAMRPVDAAGKILLANVHFAGKNLAGYDYCFEKSGNGVALASGYTAGMAV